MKGIPFSPLIYSLAYLYLCGLMYSCFIWWDVMGLYHYLFDNQMFSELASRSPMIWLLKCPHYSLSTSVLFWYNMMFQIRVVLSVPAWTQLFLRDVLINSWYLEAKIWTLGVLHATGDLLLPDPLRKQSQKIYLGTYTHKGIF